VHGQAGGNVVPSFVWLSAAWLVGRLVRSWRRRSIELELLNRELEEQRELRAQAAVAVERGRIARELHDVIAHNVSMVVVQAGAAASVLEGEQPHVRAALEAIETTGRATVDEMRRLLGVLRESEDGAALSPQPGLAGLETLVAGVREAGLPVDLRIEGSPTPLPPALDLTAYRIAQEALTNVLKHAGPARAELTVRYDVAAVEIELRDDGAGGRSNGAGGGRGLIGMRERVALWGGSLDAGHTERGWLVRARLPLRPTT
jgi:signal transduction histidine kinase